MANLLAARVAIAWSLGFHIIFAAIGMVMPFFMAASHALYLKNKNKEYLTLTKMWMRGVAVLFAIGAVSGTVLSFELGLLWPNFMIHAGPIIGMPFSWEGSAFFLEAVFIGVYMYGWDKMSPWLHWASGLLVGIAGFSSGIFILSANSWMNAPAGFDWVNGQALNIDPVKAMFNEAWLHQSLHMQLAALEAVGFAVAGIHAFFVLKKIKASLNLKALKIALTIGALAALVQLWSGHFSGERVATMQPAKFAAMEAHFNTESHADLIIGGIPNLEKERVDYAIRVPGLLSFLATESVDGVVKGLKDIPKNLWPPVKIVHFAFQIMIGLGMLLAVVGLWALIIMIRKKEFSNCFLKVLLCTLPLGFIALEAGWVVTEVGRQPWIIYGILKTSEAVSPQPGLIYHFYLFLILYILLGCSAFYLLKRTILNAQKDHL